MTLETVIATELHPSGLAQVLLSHLIDNEKKLNLGRVINYLEENHLVPIILL